VTMPDVDMYEAIYPARSLRRLKPDPARGVDQPGSRRGDARLMGGNARNSAFVIVPDPVRRRRFGAI